MLNHCRQKEAANRFFSRPSAVTQGERMWAPVVDLYEAKDVVLAFDIPGVREKDVNVSITGDLLMAKGERRFDRDLKDESCHRLERIDGKFERTIQLSMPVQADKVKATCRAGVLEVKLLKAEEVKPKEIKIDIL